MNNKRKLLQVRKALILDLDGTIRRSISGNPFYNDKMDQELMPGIEEKILKFKSQDYLIIAITNQGGVAHNFKTVDYVHEEIVQTLKLFKNGNPFDLIVECFNDSKGSVFPYNYRSLMRKPDIGMLVVAELQASEILLSIIDWDKTIMVGDREEDEKCAKNANLQHFFYIQQFLQISDEDLHKMFFLESLIF